MRQRTNRHTTDDDAKRARILARLRPAETEELREQIKALIAALNETRAKLELPAMELPEPRKRNVVDAPSA